MNQARVVHAVIPALDEESNIAGLVRSLNRVECVGSVVVVDNGSADGTAAEAARAGAVVVSEPRRGYGFACARGVEEALGLGADVIVFIDGDGSSRASELEGLVAPITEGRADLVLGSRMLGVIEAGAMPVHQRVGNRVVSVLMRLLYRIDVTDLGPYRAITADAMRSIEMQEMTFGWPTEMMVKAAKTGVRIEELPVSWDRRGGGASKVGGTIMGSIRASLDIIRVTLRHAGRPSSPNELRASGERGAH